MLLTADADRPKPPKARWYVLTVLLLIYVSNFADRQILSSIQPWLKHDLHLHDWQLGVLAGVVFGVFYAIMGIPIARLAETRNRVHLITGAIAIWSVMTAVCGLANNFWQLLFARFGVGIGEAGSGPASNSLLADYFPPRRRATVIGIFSLGVPIGALLGTIGGAYVATHWGWREAFYVVGLPGLMLGLLAFFTIKEPARGALDGRPANEPTPPFTAVVRRIFSNPTLIHLGLGTAVATFVNYGVSQFAQSFLIRGYQLTPLQAALAYGLVGCIAAIAGTTLGGTLTDHFGKRDDRWRVWIPGAGLLLAAPLYAIGFLQPTILLLSIFVVPPIVLQFLYTGPTFGLLHNMIPPRMRATAVAVVNFIINMIGLGLGPTVVGGLSDIIGTNDYAGPGTFFGTCPAGLPPPNATEAVRAACDAASFAGLRGSIVVVSLLFVWAGAHFFLAARTIKRDLARPLHDGPAEQA